MSKLIKILAVDGGGIRGLIPATILTEIEKRTGQRIATMFDLVSGTSTGGIIALGLNKPGADGQPEVAAENLIRLYEVEGKRIFSRSALRKIATADALLDEKFSRQGIEAVLEEQFGEAMLAEAVTNVLITSYDIERRIPLFFKSHKARNDPARNFLMRYVARATSAAPTFFEPTKIALKDNDYYALVDGGVFANNPTMCAFVEAKSMFPDADDFLVVSLGTGELTKPVMFDKAKDWGLAEWVQPLLSMIFDGVSNTVDYQMKQMLPTPEAGWQHYYRFQIRLDDKSDALDDTSQDNIRALKLLADTLIRDKSDELDKLCARLKALSSAPAEEDSDMD